MSNPSRSGTVSTGGDGRRWQARPLLGACLRGLVVVVPLAVGLMTGLVLTGLLPPGTGAAATVLRAVGVVAGSLLALVVCERLAWRLLPLSALLRLTLLFPDRAPSRLGVALRSSSVRRLRTWTDAPSPVSAEAGAAHQAQRVLVLAAALSAHDRSTRGHSERVRALTELVAEELRLPAEASERLQWAALLHDVGKIAVPTRILNKPGKPTPREWEVLRRHPARGARIAEPLDDWLGQWAAAISEHHERWDGTGYPSGLRGAQISLSARIVSVTDAYETMTAVRSYKRPLSAAAARDELTRCAGSHFDPVVVRAFLNVSLGRVRSRLGLASLLSQVWLVGLLPRAGAATARRLAAMPMRAVVAGLGALAVGGVVTQVVLSGSDHAERRGAATHATAAPARRAPRTPADGSAPSAPSPLSTSPAPGPAPGPALLAASAPATRVVPGAGSGSAPPPSSGGAPGAASAVPLSLAVQVGTVRVEAPPPAVTRTEGFGVEVHAAAGGVHVTAPKA